MHHALHAVVRVPEPATDVGTFSLRLWLEASFSSNFAKMHEVTRQTTQWKQWLTTKNFYEK